MIAGIVNERAGNGASIRSWLGRGGLDDVISVNQSDDASVVDLLVLSGVGAFDNYMLELRNSGLEDPIKKYAVDGSKIIIGICIGFHVLCQRSAEGQLSGLGIFEHEVKHISDLGFSRKCRVGFEEVREPWVDWSGSSVRSKKAFYLHNFGVSSAVRNEHTDSQNALPMLIKGTVFGFQFHPERSGQFGDQLLKKILRT